ncbi:alpha/beta hydrolase fold domain-containing protein [Paenibacillus sp. BSR1-1]|uniref:flavin-containing monooxygenase n=1 Tax=Paenibacillus sp. BSR1-1 TaxID=3020845 RepID=UPI0025B0A81E|nr:alpha/beta hydrolase fold domain-containing protein [Paenibacillus sp. BSR1-1]MDN3016153.1 alpha/beta hydrolase fold domain-containing protein [Paenibacillus sp. BSR1-1]
MALNQQNVQVLDAVVVGAGFSGLYMLHKLREAGYSVRVYEAGEDVGGTWYWNRYPGARCDIESIYYNYTFSEEILKEWTWSSRYAEQPEILSYINFVADKLDLKRDIQFQTRITSARYNEQNRNWEIRMEDGNRVIAEYFITALGCLSSSNIPKIKGLDSFKGEMYHTGRWPHEKVDFNGKRVGVIGTGSSGIQAIPAIAKEAGHLTVFQRTPQYSCPAQNHSLDSETIEQTRKNYGELKKLMRYSMHGVPSGPRMRSALEDSPEERERLYEKAWQEGGLFSLTYNYNDIGILPEANETAASFIRTKIKQIVKDPEAAQKLLPTYYYATKRPIIDTNYFETYNRENVSLVDIKAAPIMEITPNGIKTTDAEYDLDALVFATGFDAMTGPLFNIDIRGKNDLSLKEKWADGAELKTYLGLGTSGFPNMFMLTGPQSPSVLSNMMVSIEQHVDWVADCIDYLRKHQLEAFEATEEAEEFWSQQCRAIADMSLLTKTDSWYMGANIEGKPRGFLAFAGGVGLYRIICADVAARGYEGFTSVLSSEGTDESFVKEGFFRSNIDPQAWFILKQLESAGAPPLELLTPDQARLGADFRLLAGVPEQVAKVENRTIPVPGGEIPVRIYTPSGEGPFPALVYYHGGGWVIGNLDTVDVPCRMLANRAGCVVVSVDYRLAPEHKFPTAAEDSYAVVKWVAEQAASIQVDPERIAVGGDSAGGNLAAVVALMARDQGGPSIAYQMLIYPVTNHSYETESYRENANGYFLTKNTMVWFWNHYLRDEQDGKNPYASPLLAEDLSGLPPALVITAGFDPLRDEGEAYAERLKATGVPVEATRYDGMIHGFFWMPGVLEQGSAAIKQAANALNQAFHVVKTI